jgi:hypothetical protein
MKEQAEFIVKQLVHSKNEPIEFDPNEFTPEVLNYKTAYANENVLYTLIKYNFELFKKINKNYITYENLSNKNTQQTTAAHLIGMYGYWKEIPQELITKELLTTPDLDGNTPFHKSCNAGFFPQIPRNIITNELLQTTNTLQGFTPLHKLATSKNLHQLPKEFLTLENLLVKNKYGNTPYNISWTTGELKIIPLDFLTPENLTLECNNVNNYFTPLNYIKIQNNDHYLARNLPLKTLLSVLPGYSKNIFELMLLNKARLQVFPHYPELLNYAKPKVANLDNNHPEKIWFKKTILKNIKLKLNHVTTDAKTN